MEPFALAREHVAAFHVHADDPLFALGEAELRDLALLRDAVDEAIALHVSELIAFEGLSWAAAAAVLAPTPESLHFRYGRANRE